MQNLKQENYTVISGYKMTQLVMRQKTARYFDLKPSTILVLMILVDCYNEKNGVVYPSIAYMQDCLNINSESTVILSIKELISKRLIIKTKAKAKNAKYAHSVYSFTNLLFKFLCSPEDSHKPPMNFDETTYDFSGKPPMNFIGKKKREIYKIKEESFLKNSLSDFQKKYADVFEKITDSELQKYKSLKGYEKEDWLKAKKTELIQTQTSKLLKEKIEKEKQNSGSPLDLSKDDQIKFYYGLPPIVKKNSYFAQKIKKRWNLE